MEALKLAFETVIVGVLALPWLALVLDLFFRPGDVDQGQVWSLWSFLKDQISKLGPDTPPAVLSVL
jgi:hypothetical protein